MPSVVDTVSVGGTPTYEQQCSLPAGALSTALGGICSQSGPWLDRLLPFFAAHQASEPLVYFNVGANKGGRLRMPTPRAHTARTRAAHAGATGFNVAYILDLLRAISTPSNGAPVKNVSAPAWFAGLLQYAAEHGVARHQLGGHHGCGVCNACRGTPARKLDTPSEVTVHAFEASMRLQARTPRQQSTSRDQFILLTVSDVDRAPYRTVEANAAWLAHAFRQFGVRGDVLGQPVTERSGPVRMTPGVQLGVETGRVGQGDDKWLVWRNGTSIDDYLAASGVRRVHFLSIDAELQDLVILQGSRHALANELIDVLEFEYNSQASGSLNETAHLLHSSGYSCWWQSGWAQAGCIYPVSGACWRDTFDCRITRRCVHVGNLVCARARGRAGALLRDFSAECAQTRANASSG